MEKPIEGYIWLEKGESVVLNGLRVVGRENGFHKIFASYHEMIIDASRRIQKEQKEILKKLGES